MLCPWLSSLNCLTLLFFTSLGVGLYLHWSPSMCLAHDLVVSLDRWLDGRALWNKMIIITSLKAVMLPARLLYVSRQATVGWSGSTGCMVSLDTWAFVCGWGIPVDLNGVLLPVMSGVYLWGYDARLPQVRLLFCLCCVMVEPLFLPASRWAKAS